MRFLILLTISLNIYAYNFEVDTIPLADNFRNEEAQHYFEKRRIISIAAWGMGAGILTYLMQKNSVDRVEQYQNYLQVFGVGLLPVLALNEGGYGNTSSKKGILETQVRLLPMITQVQRDQFIPGLQICIDF